MNRTNKLPSTDKLIDIITGGRERERERGGEERESTYNCY